MRRHWEDVLQQMAREDDSFREALKSDPKKAIEDKIGAPLPGHIEVNVVEETPTSVYVVLPMDSAGEAEAMRLDAENTDFEPVADGGSWSTCGKELTCWCVTTSTCTSAGTVHGSC
jgi:hypothetical protein